MSRNMIRVVLLEPMKEARVVEIIPSLQSMQSVVDGLIEAVYPFEEQVCIVCNEEGKLAENSVISRGSPPLLHSPKKGRGGPSS